MMTETHWKKIARIYCERSTIHGFNELYYARSWFWTIFWSVIVVGGIGITVYQVKAEVKQFVADRNLALISPVDTGEAIYPDVTVCYIHWVYWLNWTKAQEMGFTKQPLLIAMSFLSNVVSAERFDVSKAKLELKRLMVENNFTEISQLLYVLAINLPSTNLSTGYLIENPILFRKKRIDYKQSMNMLCYLTPSEQVKEYLQNASRNNGKESTSISLFSFAMQGDH
uniref:Uncharacterized protein n=1 Tax=Romanomermis culicivorax TaxID=13658 RepID=A0A915JP89_ROMCU